MTVHNVRDGLAILGYVAEDTDGTFAAYDYEEDFISYGHPTREAAADAVRCMALEGEF